MWLIRTCSSYRTAYLGEADRRPCLARKSRSPLALSLGHARDHAARTGATTGIGRADAAHY